MGFAHVSSSDEALVARLRQGDQTALSEIFDRHHRLIYATSLRVLRSPEVAEEIVQEVMLRFWKQPDRYQEDRGSLRSYLVMMGRSRAIDRLRADAARRARETREARMAPEPSGSVEEDFWSVELGAEVRRALDGLSADQRRAIELAYFEGHTYRDVAQMLDRPEGTVKSWIRSGLKRLSLVLAGKGLAPVS